MGWGREGEGEEEGDILVDVTKEEDFWFGGGHCGEAVVVEEKIQRDGGRRNVKRGLEEPLRQSLWKVVEIINGAAPLRSRRERCREYLPTTSH